MGVYKRIVSLCINRQHQTSSSITDTCDSDTTIVKTGAYLLAQTVSN